MLADDKEVIVARVRIIAGTFGGRFISADVGRSTHPMGDRVRSALFAMLESRGGLQGARVLDAFAGTGALGLEALSRGADSVVFLERDKAAVRAIKVNITTLSVGDRAKVVQTGVAGWTNTSQDDKFDIIFVDPPYHDTQFSTVSRLTKYLRPEGLMILSYPGRETAPDLDGVVVVDKRIYGEAALALFLLDSSKNHLADSDVSATI
ncbi:MAG: 16S rRNA (guanine(966)-N(2))-methyltransferase RsmD [Sphaerimonospora mesophila]